MASSKSKKPPGLRQRKVLEEPDSPSCDQTLFIAFKKLKVDAKGECMKKTVDPSAVPLKHKHDIKDTEPKDENQPKTGKAISTPVDPTQQDESSEDWSQCLQKFCFCEEGVINPKGRPRWRSMCRYHRLQAKKDLKGKCSKSSTNLVQAWHTHKPLLRESKLKWAEKPGTQFTMRAARFNFKPSKGSEIRFNFVKPGAVAFSSKPETHTEVPAAGSAVNPQPATKTKKTAASGASPEDCTDAKPSEPANSKTPLQYRPVFAAEASKHLRTFSSFSPKPSGSGASSSCKPVPKFEGHRAERSSRRHHLPLWSHRGASRSTQISSSHSQTTGAVPVTAVPARLDLSVERSCSQEARLDESEFNVNELAAYFDNYLYMPKEMSSMAQMMYT